MKLDYYRYGQPQRHLEDVVNLLYGLQGDVDLEMIEREVEARGLQEPWAAADLRWREVPVERSSGSKESRRTKEARRVIDGPPGVRRSSLCAQTALPGERDPKTSGARHRLAVDGRRRGTRRDGFLILGRRARLVPVHGYRRPWTAVQAIHGRLNVDRAPPSRVAISAARCGVPAPPAPPDARRWRPGAGAGRPLRRSGGRPPPPRRAARRSAPPAPARRRSSRRRCRAGRWRDHRCPGRTPRENPRRTGPGVD
jgi:hypothetical protein